jgi:hypothetical protein
MEVGDKITTRYQGLQGEDVLLNALQQLNMQPEPKM